MKRLALACLVASVLAAGCSDHQRQQQSVNLVPASQGPNIPAAWTSADVDRAHDYFGQHPDKADGYWHTLLVVASSFDGSHWSAVAVLENGETKQVTCLPSDDGNNQYWCDPPTLALLVQRGDLVRALLIHGGTAIDRTANVILLRKTAVNFDQGH